MVHITLKIENYFHIVRKSLFVDRSLTSVWDGLTNFDRGNFDFFNLIWIFFSTLHSLAQRSRFSTQFDLCWPHTLTTRNLKFDHGLSLFWLSSCWLFLVGLTNIWKSSLMLLWPSYLEEFDHGHMDWLGHFLLLLVVEELQTFTCWPYLTLRLIY